MSHPSSPVKSRVEAIDTPPGESASWAHNLHHFKHFEAEPGGRNFGTSGASLDSGTRFPPGNFAVAGSAAHIQVGEEYTRCDELR
jgi:hypothetical protein